MSLRIILFWIFSQHHNIEFLSKEITGKMLLLKRESTTKQNSHFPLSSGRKEQDFLNEKFCIQKY